MDLLKTCQENGTLDSCSSDASTSNACSSPVHLKNGTTDGSFKTPAVPQKKTNVPIKKRLATPEAEGHDSEIGHLNSKIDALGLAKDSKAEDNQSDSTNDSKTENGHPSTMCPNGKKCFADRYPHLTVKSTSKPAEELLEEIIVDEFSLILFNSIDDFKAFKLHSDEVIKRENFEEEQRRIAALAAAEEEQRRIAALPKKKGRKSKAEIERAQRLLQKQQRHERREKKRLHKEQRRLRRERAELVIKNETTEQKEQREQRLRERHELHNQRREQRKKKKQLKTTKKAQQKVLSAQGVSTTLQSSPAVAPATLAQRQRLEQQLFMRNQNTHPSGMDDLLAAAAFMFATNPAEVDSANAVLMAAQNARHQASENAQTPGHSTPSATASSSVHPNENGGQPESSRPSSVLSGPKRPTPTASAKRPLSVLDPQQQQLNGPSNKMMKLEEGDYRKDLLAMQANQAGSRRNSLQNQQMPPRLYSPFVGMQPMLNGVLPATADPNIRFAVPQHLIPMGVQRATNPQQQFDPSQLANIPMSALPIASLLPPGMLPASLNPMMQQVLNPAAAALARSQPNPAVPIASSISAAGPTTSAINKPFTTLASDPLVAANPQLNLFANNPDFAASLSHALSALNAVDPALLSLNQHLLSIGAQNLPGQTMPLTANSLMSQLNEAQKQLEQLGQRQPQRTPLGVQQPAFAQQPNSSPVVQKQSIGGIKPPFMQQQSQIRTAQIPISNIPSKPQQIDFKKVPTPQRSQKPSASNSQISTPGEPSTSIGVLKNPAISSGTLPIAVVGPTMGQGKTETTVQATVPLSRPITPTFASSIGIQLPMGTALASQLAGAAKLGSKATIGTKSAINRTHVDVAEMLQKLFSETPELDDGSREGQTCAQFPQEWRMAANSQALHLQSPPKETSSDDKGEASKEQVPTENEESETIRVEQQGNETTRPGSATDQPKEEAKVSEPNGVNPTVSQAQATLPQVQAELPRIPTNLPTTVSVPSSVPQMRAQTVVAQQQDQRVNLLQAQQLGLPVSSVQTVSTEALLRQQLQAAQDVQALQQQIMASQASNQNRVQPSTVAFPFAQKGPTTSRTPVSNAPQASNVAMQLAGATALHPSLSSVGLGQGGLTAGLPVNNINSDQVKLMNLIYQQQNAQKQKEAEQLRNIQAVAGREMAKKSNASSLQIKKEQEQMRQTPRQMQPTPQGQQQFGQGVAGLPAELANAQNLGNNYAQNLPPSAQFMLQQLMGGQGGQQLAQMQAALAGGVPANLLEQLALQSRMGQLPQQAMQAQAAQQRPPNTQSQLLAQQAQAANSLQRHQQLNVQQLASNFPGLQAQMAQSVAAQQTPANIQSVAALSSARPGHIDPNQLLALSLIQQQANMMENQVARSMPQTSQIPQQQAQPPMDPNNADILQQLQNRMMLERSMNPLLQNQSMPQQNQQQSLLQQLQLAQQAQQLQQLQNGLAPINPNQLANLVGSMPNLLEADLMRQFIGQQPPANLQRNVQDRQQKAEQHRQFREQLIAAANSAPNQVGASSAAPGPVAPNLYQLAALQQNGQASAAAQMASLQQQQALASQIKNPASLMGTPQKN